MNVMFLWCGGFGFGGKLWWWVIEYYCFDIVRVV